MGVWTLIVTIGYKGNGPQRAKLVKNITVRSPAPSVSAGQQENRIFFAFFRKKVSGNLDNKQKSIIFVVSKKRMPYEQEKRKSKIEAGAEFLPRLLQQSKPANARGFR